MRQNRLNPYREALTPEQAAEGIRIAKRNARSLAADARHLLQAHRKERAAALAILAMEEAGKVSLLRGILLASSELDLKREWRAYRAHTAKNFMALFRDYAEPGSRLDDFRVLMEDGAWRSDVDAVKQLGFYTDCYGKAHWSSPDAVIDEELATRLVEDAELVTAGDGPFETAAELQLWVKHLQPVWRTTLQSMKAALAACYREASELGVLRGHQTPAAMEQFLGLTQPG